MRYFKTILKFILFVIILLIIFWIIALSSLQTEKGQKWALNTLIQYIEKSTQTEVHIDKVEFVFPLHLRIHQLTLQKDNTPILSINLLDFGCKAPHLLEGRLVCSLLHAKGVDIQHFLPPSSSASSVSRWGDSIIPLYAKIENLLIEDLQVNPTLIDELVSEPALAALLRESVFSIQGHATNNPFKKSLSAHFSILASDPTGHHSPIKLTLDAQNHHLAFSLHSNHFPLKAFLDSPEPIQIDAAYYASAPLQSWQNFISGREQGEPIEGNFKIQLCAEKTHTIPSVLIGQMCKLKGKYTLSLAKELSLFDLKIESPCCTLQGDATILLESQLGKGVFSGKLYQLEQLAQWLPKIPQGDIDFEGNFDGFLTKPFVVLKLTSPLIHLDQGSFTNVQSVISSQINEEMIEGSLTLEINHHQNPYHFTSSFAWNKDQYLALPQLQLQALGTQLKGNLTLLTPDFVWDGHIQAYSHDLSLLSPLIALPLQGDALVNVYLKPERQPTNRLIQDLACQVQCGSFQWSDLRAKNVLFTTHLEEPLEDFAQVLKLNSHVEGSQIQWSNQLSAEYLQIKAQCLIRPSELVFNPTQVSAQIEGHDVRQADIRMEHFLLTTFLLEPLKSLAGEFKFITHQLKSPAGIFQELAGESQIDPQKMLWPFQLHANGHFKAPLNFTTTGAWRYDQKGIEAHIEQNSGNFGPYAFQLLNPFTIIHEANNVQLSNLRLQFGDANLEANFITDQQTISCQCRGDGIPSEIVHFFAPNTPITGRFSFICLLDGPLKTPRGRLHLFLHQVQVTEEIFAKNPYIEGKMDFDIAEAGIRLSGALHGIGRNPVLAEGVLPVIVSLSPPAIHIDDNIPFHVNLQAEGELDPYLHLLYNDNTNLTGQTKIALTINGKMSAPQIRGEVDLYNGSYESLSTGAIYRNIQARLEGNGSELILKNFSAKDHTEGSITAEGMVRIDTANHFPFEFHIRPSRIFIIESDYAKITASGSLILSGNKKQARLSGTMDIDRAEISMEEALPSQVKSVDIKYVNIAEGEDIPAYAQPKEASWLNLDVKFNMANGVSIKGNNLTSEWKGSLNINGHLDNLLVYGDLRITKGEYDLHGKVFNLSQGNIHFAGPADKKTSIYVVASKEIDRIRAEIIVKGPTNKLAVSFRSDPPMSQREVLSYILFNRGTSDITTDQGEQLTQSFMALNTASASSTDKNNQDLFSKLRGNIPLIDRLDFSRNIDNNELSLQVGKYIAEGVLFSVNKSLNDSGYSGAIEVNIRKNLKAQVEVGEVDEAIGGKASLKWKKDY